MFSRRKPFDDGSKQEFVEAISSILEIQIIAAGGGSLEDPATGSINGRALGYVYGFIDAALRTIGQDMGDVSIGVPITFQVLARLCPGRQEHYVNYLAEHMGTDPQVTTGAMVGGQQYIDFNNQKLAAPMGLAKYILDQQ